MNLLLPSGKCGVDECHYELQKLVRRLSQQFKLGVPLDGFLDISVLSFQIHHQPNTHSKTHVRWTFNLSAKIQEQSAALKELQTTLFQL